MYYQNTAEPIPFSSVLFKEKKKIQTNYSLHMVLKENAFSLTSHLQNTA